MVAFAIVTAMATIRIRRRDEAVKIQAAVVKEQDVTFTVVVVKPHVINSQHEARQTAATLTRYFPGMPIVLMAQDANGRPTYLGRPDIVKFLANVFMEALPWKEFTFQQAA